MFIEALLRFILFVKKFFMKTLDFEVNFSVILRFKC